jgi:predicted regulator of Ras-like GTPase activity (Roadblock/LC7/MglB family)
VLRDKAGVFRVCLFGPGALEPAPLAHLARDLFEALEEAKVGPMTSITLRLETHRLVVRALGSPAGHTTLLVVVGPMTRPGLARLELERAAKAIGG